jgi:phospholipid/cholesterol/gamma-HCH transport system substrate-binding protein
LKIKKEVKIGFLFIVTLAISIWGLNYLKGKDIFTKQRLLYAIYDNINGLQVSNPVLLKGFKIGQVKDIHFTNDSNARIAVIMSITSDIKIPKKTVAKIFSEDLLGSKAIELQFGKSVSYVENGDTLMSDLQASLGDEVNRQMLPVKQKAEKLMASLDTVLASIQYIFNENTRDNLRISFESIKVTIDKLRNTLTNVDTIISEQKNNLSSIILNVQSFTSNLKKNNQEIDNILNNISTFSDTLTKLQISKTISKANKAINDISLIIEKVNRGEGSIGLLINNDSLYRNLNSSSKELNELLKDIKLNPHRYVHVSVFGRNPKKNKYSPASKY